METNHCILLSQVAEGIKKIPGTVQQGVNKAPGRSNFKALQEFPNIFIPKMWPNYGALLDTFPKHLHFKKCSQTPRILLKIPTYPQKDGNIISGR